MIQLDISANEQETLKEVLESFLSDLRMEIVETDSHDFKVMLKERRTILEKVVGMLQ